jgi:ribosomal protection tetracycline resistance protein
LQPRTLNLGILAHVDAGKTTLTERLLYAAGVISEIGSVDAGTTQTDSLALERRRGITIRSAVASFAVGDVTVNLIDTPGHPDFIAEVERVLSVLDGAVLVVSAVEGVQPQTRILQRALQRLGIPTLIFVNKIDRPGADGERVLRAIAARLTPGIAPMGQPAGLGTRAARFIPWADDSAAAAGLAELLAEHDDSILAAYVDGAGISCGRLRAGLAAQTSRALVHPVFFGSAITGAGVGALMSGVAELLPAATGDAGGPASGRVFKIERGAAGEKVAYARMFSGAVAVRDQLRFGDGRAGKVTAISVFERGPTSQRASVAAGEIGKLWGLAEVQVGDDLWQPGAAAGPRRRPRHEFAPPTLESVVIADSGAGRARLRAALGQLAEQDPLINVRQDDSLGEVSVSLYGEVQKEVIQATLADDFGIGVTFRETTTICIERAAGTGEAAEMLGAPANPYPATLGLRVEPAPAGSGVAFKIGVGVRSVPLYVYKTMDSFAEIMSANVRHALREGLLGWEVADCTVTLTECGYVSPNSTAAHFRKLTPLVLIPALARAGTVVCEPMVRVAAEVPTAAVSAVLAASARLGGVVERQWPRDGLSVIEAVLPAARAQELQRQLPGLTNGEGVAETSFGGYRPVAGTPPARRRTMPDPRNRDEYLLHLAGRSAPRGTGP